jgi:ABC-2 type transport system permease protein
METIYILWLRQLKRYSRSKSRIIGLLGQPILFLIALGFGFGPIYAKAGGGNYIEFITPGIIAMSVLFTASFMGGELIWDKEFGFLKETLVAPVSRFKIMIGKTLGGATVAVIQGLVVFLLSLLIGFRVENWLMLPAAILVLALIAIVFTALGTALAARMEDMQGFQLIVNFLIMPLFFLSGGIFPLTDVPKAIKIVALLNPLTHGIDGLRTTLTNMPSGLGIIADLGILTAVAILLIIIGGYLFSKVEA